MWYSIVRETSRDAEGRETKKWGGEGSNGGRTASRTSGLGRLES